MEDVSLQADLEERVRSRTLELEEARERLRVANLRLARANARLAEEIGERHRAEAEARQLSLTDELTGLRNRRGFFLLAEQELKVARRVGGACTVVFVDIDGLKRINDALGHELGSEMIRDAAAILRSVFAEGDVVGRVGGDEFAVYSPGSGPGPDVLRARLLAAVETLNANSERPYAVSLSVGGVATRVGQATVLDELLAMADRDMYGHRSGRVLERERLPRFRLAPVTAAG
jgi:diguanylate cyclase (GGDEF)-like protein